MRIRTALSNLALLAASLVIALGLAEVVLRTTHVFGARIAWTTPDPILGYRLRPGARYWSTQENDHPIIGRINRFGWRDVDWPMAKPPGGYRVAVLGDSFVEAMQVEEDSTSLRLAQAALSAQLARPVELMNFGGSGFTQSEELLVLQRDVLRFNPDLVLVFFFPGNDIADVSRQTATSLQRPFFHLSASGLLLDTSFASTRMYALRSRLDRLKRHSALVSLLAERYVQWRRQHAESGQTAMEGYLALCTRHPPRAYLDDYRLNKRLLQAMEDTLAVRGIQFGIVVLPLPTYVATVRRRIEALDPTFDEHYYEKDLSVFAGTHKIGILRLEDAFAAAGTGQSMPLNWRGVGHWTYAGHRVVAQALAEWLRPVIAGRSAQERPNH